MVATIHDGNRARHRWRLALEKNGTARESRHPLRGVKGWPASGGNYGGESWRTSLITRASSRGSRTGSESSRLRFARSSLRTTSARMHRNVCLLVFAFLPLSFPRSYVVLTRLPSTSTCERFLIVVETYSASRGRNTQTRCHSVF